MNMKEELTSLIYKLVSDCSKENIDNVFNAIEKYDKYIRRLNLDAQRYFDSLMDLIHSQKGGE